MTSLISPISGECPTHLFFAALPSQDASIAIEQVAGTLQRAHRLRGQRIATSRLHVSLASFHASQSPAPTIVARAKSVGADIRHSIFPLCLEWSESFWLDGRRHPLVLRGADGVRALTGFRREVAARMSRAGFPVERSFTPHMTLLWADRCVEAHPIVPIHWTVKDFVLVLSLVGKSRHIHLARWQLR